MNIINKQLIKAIFYGQRSIQIKKKKNGTPERYQIQVPPTVINQLLRIADQLVNIFRTVPGSGFKGVNKHPVSIS
jgi:hypothetical protein